MRCAEEFPLLEQARERYKEHGLEILYIGHQDRVEKLTEYATQNGLPDYLFDEDDSVSLSFGMTYGGGVVFIDPTGMVRARIPKGISPERVEEEMLRILPR